MNRWFVPLGTVLILLAGCQKEDALLTHKLPPTTTTGAETLGFLLDGRAWVPDGQRCGIYGCADNKVEASAYTQNGRLHVLVSAARTGLQLDQAVTLTLDSVAGPGTYKLGGPTQLVFANNRQGTTYERAATGQVTLTRVDTVQWVVAGTFRGRLEDPAHPGQFVTITEGRFDVLYNR